MDEARKMLEKSLELWQGRDEELPEVCAKHYNGQDINSPY